MNAKKIVIQILMTGLLMSSNLLASSTEQIDTIAQRMGELEKRESMLRDEAGIEKNRTNQFKDQHFMGCSEGLLGKAGAFSAAGLMSAVTAVLTGVAAVGETLLVELDISSSGISLKEPFEESHKGTIYMANFTNDAVTAPFNKLSDKQCAELEKEIIKGKEKQGRIIGEVVKVWDIREYLKTISERPRGVTDLKIVFANDDKKNDREVAQSR